MYFGTVEVSQGISIDRKLSLTTRTVADLASQVTTINNADMTNLLKATSAVISPYPCDPLTVKVSAGEDRREQQGDGRVERRAQRSARAKGSAVTLPGALLIAKPSWSGARLRTPTSRPSAIR